MEDIFTKIDIKLELDQIEIPAETLSQWQYFLEILLEFTASKDALINNYQPPYLEVEKTEARGEKIFKEQDKFKIRGLYCEEVVNEKSKIIVNNAAKNPQWQDSIYLENGLISYLGYPILWPNGEIFGTICIHDDQERQFTDQAEKIMEMMRNLIENDLEIIYQNHINKNMRNYYSQLYNLLPVGIVIEDAVGNIIWANDKIFEISGYQREDLIGKNVLDTLALEKDREKAKENMQKILAGQILDHKVRSSTAAGDHIYFRLKEKKIELPNGKTGIISIQSDISDTVKVQEKIKQASLHDSLTSLKNRSYLEKRIQKLDTAASLPIAVIMVDVDGLKLVNDTYGHHNGDLLLKKMADILENSCREDDVLSRWGGDEFVILLLNSSKKAAKKVVERIEEKTKNSLLELENGSKIPISAAVGYHLITDYYQDIFAGLAQAEKMMYKNKLVSSRKFKRKIINKMIKSLNQKSRENKSHVKRMTKLAKKLAEKINLSEAEQKKAALTARLHDLGKIVIKKEVLNKKEKLTAEEWQEIKEHPAVGHRILNASEEFSHISEEVLSHHENWDGTGYPRALKGEEIPIIARIIAIVDAYEVMTSNKSYKNSASKTISKKEALKEIKEKAGTQFDPSLAEEFIELMTEAEKN